MALPHDETARRPARRVTARAVFSAALGTYRRRFWRAAAVAAVIIVPVDLVVAFVTAAAQTGGEDRTLVWTLRIATGAADWAALTLGTTFFAGVLDRIVAADRQGRTAPTLRQVFRGLPLSRLVLVDLVATALIFLGLLAFGVPGIVLATLLSIVGPLVVIEDLRVWPAIRRSAGLVWPRFFLTFFLVVVPTVAEQALVSWLEQTGVREHLPVRLVVDVALTAVVGSFIGMIEITLAHELIADQRARLTQKTAGRPPDAPPAAEAQDGMPPARDAASPGETPPRHGTQ